jgi:hypothetical protein
MKTPTQTRYEERDETESFRKGPRSTSLDALEVREMIELYAPYILKKVAA